MLLQKTLSKIADSLLDVSKTWPEQTNAKKKEFLKAVRTMSALAIHMLKGIKGDTGGSNID